MQIFINLFIDESGKSLLTDKKYQDFILTGLAIPNTELAIISGYFSFIKRKYKLMENIPFHTYDLLENSNSSVALNKTETKLFLSSMKEFLELIPFNIFIIHTNKVKFLKQYKITEVMLKGSKENKERNGIIYSLSSLTLLEYFARYLEKDNQYGQVHADSRKYLDSQLLKAFLDIKEPNLRGNIKNNNSNYAKRLCSIEFAEKSALSSGIELADFVSYVVFAKLRKQLTKLHLEKIWKIIEEKPLKIVNLKEELVKRYL